MVKLMKCLGNSKHVWSEWRVVPMEHAELGSFVKQCHRCGKTKYAI